MMGQFLKVLKRKGAVSPRTTGRLCRTRLEAELLEERTLLNSAWGGNGPPLSINTTAASSTSVAVTAGAASTGSASISSRNEVDYFRFTPPASGFYALSASGKLDSMVAVYTYGTSGKLLGYADNYYASATERMKVYLESGRTYVMAISNYLTYTHGSYTWKIDATGTDNPIRNNDARILYLNFDGATLKAADLRTWDNDWDYGSAAEFDPKNNGVTVKRFLSSRSDRETIISNIVNYVQQDMAPFGVRVVRLAAGSSAVDGDRASTIFVGSSTLQDLSASDPNRDLFHVACDIDLGNNNLTDIAFVYDEDWGSASATALAVADVVLHEAGHTYGLFHVKSGSSMETMGLRYSNSNEDYWVNNSRYVNRSFSHREFSGSQDSYQEMAAAFGVRSDQPTVPADVSLASLRREEFLLVHPHGSGHDHVRVVHGKIGTLPPAESAAAENSTASRPIGFAPTASAGSYNVLFHSTSSPAAGPLAMATSTSLPTSARNDNLRFTGLTPFTEFVNRLSAALDSAPTEFQEGAEPVEDRVAPATPATPVEEYRQKVDDDPDAL